MTDFQIFTLKEFYLTGETTGSEHVTPPTPTPTATLTPTRWPKVLCVSLVDHQVIPMW